MVQPYNAIKTIFFVYTVDKNSCIVCLCILSFENVYFCPGLVLPPVWAGTYLLCHLLTELVYYKLQSGLFNTGVIQPYISEPEADSKVEEEELLLTGHLQLDAFERFWFFLLLHSLCANITTSLNPMTCLKQRRKTMSVCSSPRSCQLTAHCSRAFAEAKHVRTDPLSFPSLFLLLFGSLGRQEDLLLVWTHGPLQIL